MVDVYFDWALYNAKCAVKNDVTNTREEFPDSFRRQAEPIGEHHKLIPVEKSENGGWIYEAKFPNKIVAGPYSDLKSRRVFYTCEYHRCQIGCPCMRCCVVMKLQRRRRPHLKIMPVSPCAAWNLQILS